MMKSYTKKEFQELDFDSKCTVIQNFMYDDYMSGQEEINFYLPPNFTGKEEVFPETPIEIKEIEDKKFNLLILRLTDKLFENKQIIQFDFENIDLE